MMVNVNGRMAGRCAVITGGARGIGRSTAELFLKEGARVALIDQDEDVLKDTCKSLSANSGQLLWFAANVNDASAIGKVMDEVASRFGGINVLVNNAAARAFGPVADASDEDWERVLSVNILGLSHCTRAALPHLRRSEDGAIVNVSSVFALAGRVNMGLYDATKAAILALTRALACEEARYGIRVNAVCPSSTLTPWTIGRADARGMDVEELKRTGAVPSLLNRWALPDEVAYPILWLASSEASFITGVSLPVDGGLTAA